MIYENVVSGIKTPIKKLYEYVNGTKQEIQERYELVNGRKELVFKNKTIKTMTIYNPSGFCNAESGTTGKINKWKTSTISLGEASGKKIVSIKGEIGIYAINMRTTEGSASDYQVTARLKFGNIIKDFVLNNRFDKNTNYSGWVGSLTYAGGFLSYYPDYRIKTKQIEVYPNQILNNIQLTALNGIPISSYDLTSSVVGLANNTNMGYYKSCNESGVIKTTYLTIEYEE